jgi:predicted  nucleic acid-binding Zn-ribbon protein
MHTVAALGGLALGSSLLAVAAGDARGSPREHSVRDRTAQAWFNYAQSWQRTSGPQSFGEYFVYRGSQGIGYGIEEVTRAVFGSELDRLQAEIDRLQEQIATKRKEIEELKRLLAECEKEVSRYAGVMEEQGSLTQEGVEALTQVTSARRGLLKVLDDLDALVQEMVGKFERIDNTALLSQYAQLQAGCAKEREEIEALRAELKMLQGQQTPVAESVVRSAERLSASRTRRQNSLSSLNGSIQRLSPDVGTKCKELPHAIAHPRALFSVNGIVTDS